MAPLRRRKATEMEGLFDPEKVDLVAVAPDGRTVQIYIVADIALTGSDEQLHSLQWKIHNSVGFVVQGQMVAHFPETEGLPWEIVITCRAGPPDTRTSDLIRRTVEPVRRQGGDLRVETANAV